MRLAGMPARCHGPIPPMPFVQQWASAAVELLYNCAGQPGPCKPSGVPELAVLLLQVVKLHPEVVSVRFSPTAVTHNPPFLL